MNLRDSTVHGLIQTARGLCTDEAPHVELDALLAEAVEAVKDIEAERDRHRRLVYHLVNAIDQYMLWEPGRAGHAAAHQRLKEARDAAA